MFVVQSGTMYIGAAFCRVYTQLPTQRCPGCLSCFARILDLLAKELLEVVGQHSWPMLRRLSKLRTRDSMT